MIGVSKLYCGAVEASDPLRYGRLSKDLPSHLLQFSSDKKPVVVWNVTRRCNLKCVHCYSQSEDRDYSGELTYEQGIDLLNDLSSFGVPVVLFSGGETADQTGPAGSNEARVFKGDEGRHIYQRLLDRRQNGKITERGWFVLCWDKPGRP